MRGSEGRQSEMEGWRETGLVMAKGRRGRMKEGEGRKQGQRVETWGEFKGEGDPQERWRGGTEGREHGTENGRQGI